MMLYLKLRIIRNNHADFVVKSLSNVSGVTKSKSGRVISRNGTMTLYDNQMYLFVEISCKQKATKMWK